MQDEARRRLAEQQHRLVKALLESAEVPAGFDPAQVETASQSLRRKRARTVARTWPRLAEALGMRFDPLFEQFAANHRLPPGGAVVDGRQFAAFLQKQRLLPDAGRLEVLAFDLRYVIRRGQMVKRRWPAIRVMAMRDQPRIVGGVFLPLLGSVWFCVPTCCGAGRRDAHGAGSGDDE